MIQNCHEENKMKVKYFLNIKQATMNEILMNYFYSTTFEATNKGFKIFQWS